MITCLGWSPSDKHSRIPHGRSIKLAFFIVTKHANRTERMLNAVALSERLCGWLKDWKCQDALLNGCVGTFDASSLVAENLYGRASDSTGLGLWLVRASIDLSYCALTEPAVSHGGSMNNFMITLKEPSYTIESNAVTRVDEDDDAPLPNIEQSIDLNGHNIGSENGNQTTK